MQWIDRVGHRIKLRDLHMLMTVVRAGSMGKAARSLNTSQPAISRSIAELEHTLGVRLLDRHLQGIEPTEYGRALLECGVTVFDDLRSGIQKIEFLADPTAGEVRIGTNPALAATFVSAVVDRLSRRHPRIVFHLVVEQVETLHHELNLRKIDLLIVRRYDLFSEEQFCFETLYDISYVIVAGSKHPLARRRRIEFVDLLSESWVLAPLEVAFGSATMKAFRASGIDYPRATVFAAPADVRVSLLNTGRFLSIFTTDLLRFPTKRPELKVLPVRLPIAPAPIGIVTLRDRTLSPVALLFANGAYEVAKPLAKAKG